MVTELKRRVDLPESSQASKLSRCDDTDQSGWGLEPKHTIFLSHSGEQKNFTERLWVELKRAHYFPFFDKCPDSLPKGHDFPPAIIQATRQCHVAILVLSEAFFTRSRWPMIELNEFVKAQASSNSTLKLLPLFYKISVQDFKDAKRQKQWEDIWKGWAEEDDRTNRTHRLDVDAWTSALSKVGSINGLEYVDEVGEATYVADVVEAVRKLKLPRVQYDVSHVQSLQGLCEPIFAKFCDSKDDHHGYKVVGLFGEGGIGKTTITKAMCNGDFGDFDGDFCHIEFGVKDVGVLRKQVLQDLMGEASLPDDLDKLKTLLKKCMQHQKVFLCLDNVWTDDIEEAKMYLDLNYKVGSKVLVTSRSHDVLQGLKLQESHCMEMPELSKVDAREVFLHYVGLVSTYDINEEESDVINQCVQKCHFPKPSLHGVRNDSSTKQYLPLALKVWGIQLGQISICPLEWRTSLENLKIHRFNRFRKKIHPLFSLLRQGYDSLRREDQLIFLDLAIFVIRAMKASKYGISKFDIVQWLQHAYNREVSINESLEALKRNALLDFLFIENALEYRIHDLYLQFAEEEVQTLESISQTNHILYDFGGVRLHSRFQSNLECKHLTRIGIYKSKVKSITRDILLHCSQVEVFQIYGCKNLEELDVEGMDGLRILDVVGCEKLGYKFQGVNKLKDLEWLRLHFEDNQVFLGDLSSLTALQFLELHSSREHFLHFPNVNGCKNLRELKIDHSKSYPNWVNLTMLEKVQCWNCSKTKCTIGLNSLTNLKVLDLAHCSSLVELPGLCNLATLEILNVSQTAILELHGIRKLHHLQELRVANCLHLTSLVELEYVTSLRRLDACLCDALLKLPNMSNLKELEKVDLTFSAISMVPYGFGRLAKKRIFKLYGCTELLEPLVLWLWEQELLSLEELNDSIFPGLSRIGESEDELRCNIRKDVIYYMDQVTICPGADFGSASQCNSLEEKEGGLDFAIKALCEHEDLDILSLVVAKYSTKDIAKIAIPKISTRIMDYLNRQLNSSSRECDDGYTLGSGHGSFFHIQFILQHVIKNEMLLNALKDDNIIQFVNNFVDKDEYIDDHLSLGDSFIVKTWASHLGFRMHF